MELPAFAKNRPIATTVFVVGAGIVLLWAVASRVASPKSGDAATVSDPVTLSTNLPDANAQLQAGTQIQLAQIQAQSDAKAQDYQAGVQLAQLGVQQTLGTLEYQVQDRAGERTYNLGQDQLGAQERMFSVQQGAENYQAGLAAGLEAQRAQLDAQTTQLFATNQLQAALDANATTRAVTSAQTAAATSAAKSSSKTSIIGTIGGVIGSVLKFF